MQEKYLPIGSVVLLKGGKKRLMITGYCMQTQEKPGVIYDYSGCIFPEGVIRSDITSVFNHDQIVRIDFTGFSDDEDEFLAWLQFREEENSVNHEDEYLTSLKNYDIINI